MSAGMRWLDVGQIDDMGRMNSPIHHLDARAKLIVTLAFIVVVMSFDRYAISALTPFFLFLAVLIAAARLPMAPLLRKLLLAAPFAVLVGAFNPFFDHQPVLQIGGWTISGGWISFTNILLRFVLTVGAALALLATTGMYRLCAALEQLGVPPIFVTQLLFLYRYLFVISDEGAQMVRSVRMRSGVRGLSFREYGGLVGHLLMRSLDRAERVHQAMLTRGFDGNIRRLDSRRFGLSDALFLIFCLSVFIVARSWNLAEHLGRLLN